MNLNYEENAVVGENRTELPQICLGLCRNFVRWWVICHLRTQSDKQSVRVVQRRGVSIHLLAQDTRRKVGYDRVISKEIAYLSETSMETVFALLA